jgi:hypothetical protein
MNKMLNLNNRQLFDNQTINMIDVSARSSRPGVALTLHRWSCSVAFS